MKKIGAKTLSLLLALVLAVTVFAVPALAANGERYSVSSAAQHNEAIAAKQAELEDKYGIFVFYPTYELDGVDTAAIYLETLETLETALSYVTPTFVRQVSTYYYEQNGKRLRFTYKFADMSNTTEITVGGFDPDRSLIELYIPRKGKGAAVSGDAPLTIVHEFGHAVQIMTGNKYGESKMQSEWKAMNGDHTYRASNIESNPSETTFVSGYAATDFAEDFAETFAHAFVCNRSGLGITGKLTSNGASTNLGKKFNYVYTIISTYFPQATTALENFQKLYSTSTSLTYGGVKLSGSYLQFIGYSEPRYLPLTVLDMFPEVRESQYKWIKEIGGWFATREGKDNLIVFPGGNWGTTSSTLS